MAVLKERCDKFVHPEKSAGGIGSKTEETLLGENTCGEQANNYDRVPYAHLLYVHTTAP
jgi:hypothetical protein